MAYNTYTMEKLERYNHLNQYYKNKFGERVLKICIDGGFTCPNRDGTKSSSGCIFCSEKGSGDHLNSGDSITMQIKNHLTSYRGKRANKFIAYFQNFSNTYDTIENLKEKYDAALIDNRIIGISIATRPDCINKDVVNLLKTYTNKYYISVELGFQTANEETAKIINRCYTNETFTNAVTLLYENGIDVIAHMLVGLPNETLEDIKNTVYFLNSQQIQGLKVHSLYIVKNTKLEQLYNDNLYTPITLEYYLDALIFIITHIRKDIILHRISGDAPKDLLVAPTWNIHKKLVLNGVDKILKEKNLYQGIFLNQ